MSSHQYPIGSPGYVDETIALVEDLLAKSPDDYMLSRQLESLRATRRHMTTMQEVEQAPKPSTGPHLHLERPYTEGDNGTGVHVSHYVGEITRRPSRGFAYVVVGAFVAVLIALVLGVAL